MKKLILITVILMLILSSCNSVENTGTTEFPKTTETTDTTVVQPTTDSTATYDPATSEAPNTNGIGTLIMPSPSSPGIYIRSIEMLKEYRELLKLEKDDPVFIQKMEEMDFLDLMDDFKEELSLFYDVVDTFPLFDLNYEFVSVDYIRVENRFELNAEYDTYDIMFSPDSKNGRFKFRLLCFIGSEGSDTDGIPPFTKTVKTKDGKVTVELSEISIEWMEEANSYRMSCYCRINGTISWLHYWVESDPESVDIAKLISESNSGTLKELTEK